MAGIKEKLAKLNWRKTGTWMLVYAGVVAPILCFGMATQSTGGIGIGESDWQDGSLSTYTSLLMSFPAVTVFFPLLLYCIVSLSFLLWDWERWKERFVVRFGIYSGIPLAAQYCWIIYFSTMGINSWNALFAFAPGILLLTFITMVGVVSINSVYRFLSWLLKLYGWKRLLGTVALVLYAILYVALITGRVGLLRVIFAPLAIFFLYTLVLGPFWSLCIYTGYTIALLYDRRKVRFQFGLKRAFAVVTWITSYFAAWRISVDLMLVEYAKLPKEAPQDCFVATAAARGHHRLVKGFEVQTPTGECVRVSQQMQVLKGAELLLQAICPRGHQLLRRFYNHFGPKLASRISTPWRADTAYLALKPAEWIAMALFKMLLDNNSRAATISKLYKGRSDDAHE